MVNKPSGAAAPGLAAPDAAKKHEAPELAGGGGSEEVQQEETGAIVEGFEPSRKPPATDADLPAFLALMTAAARDGWSLTRIVAEGQPIYFLARLTFRQDFHALDELRAFLASRGVRS